ncbi:MAG TPA: hypothetical protein VGF84_09605 [Micromonosporaceae bacterium]
MRNRLRLTTIAGVVAAMTLLAGCKSTTTSGAPSDTAPTTTQTTAAAPSGVASAPSGAASAAVPSGDDPGAGAVSSAHIRVANFYAPKGQPGPGIDVYDVQLQGQPAKPILTDVAYGTVSDYAVAHQILNSYNKIVEFNALPTGEDPVAQKADAAQIGGLIDDGSGAQETILLTASDDDNATGTSLIGSISDSYRLEKGDDGQGGKGPVAPPVTSGGGQILVDTTAIPDNLNPGLYLMIDKSCAPPLNGDPNVKGVPYVFAADGATPNSSFAVFAAATGTHQVSVVSWKSSTQPSCKQLTKLQGTTSVTVTANQQVELYVYGSALDALHIALAPIQP